MEGGLWTGTVRRLKTMGRGISRFWATTRRVWAKENRAHCPRRPPIGPTLRGLAIVVLGPRLPSPSSAPPADTAPTHPHCPKPSSAFAATEAAELKAARGVLGGQQASGAARCRGLCDARCGLLACSAVNGAAGRGTDASRSSADTGDPLRTAAGG
ncbi:hypothetical protein ACP4OV_015993 [Aristida adscensionis]